MLLGLTIALRLPGMFSDLWIDEIWAMQWAFGLKRALALFTEIHFDTNHWLYTLWLYMVGPGLAAAIYRVPALLCGVAVVLLLGRGRSSREASFLAMLLGATSYLLVVYSSEARGYSATMCFALIAQLTLQRYMVVRHYRWALLFGIACTLGLLSHLTFLFALSAFGAWSICAELKARAPRGRAVANLLACYALPVAAFGFLYLFDIRHIRHGGADVMALHRIVLEFAAQIVGLPDIWITASLALILILGAVVWSICRQRERREWVFYLTVLFLSPAAFILLKYRSFNLWQVRHFLICLPFLLILLAEGLASLWRAGKTGRMLTTVLVVIYLFGNGVRIAEFIKLGRGHYGQAVEYMAANTSGPVITVCSDHDFRNPMLLNHYGRHVAGKRLEYYGAPLGDVVPDWYITHATPREHSPQKTIVFASGVRYELARHFPYSGISGWHWCLYRRSSL